MFPSLETLVISMCMLQSGSPCEKSAQAYYQYNHLDDYAQEFGRKNKELVFIGSIVTTVAKREFTVPAFKHVVLKRTPDVTGVVFDYGF
jgi:hypothetical protein